jgi:hypothetical protein
MLAKNTRALVATVAVALITGIMVALLLALMPAPAQAQAGDVLRFLSIKAADITDDEGGIFGDFIDEPYIKVDGVEVWSGRSDPLRMKNGDVHNLTGVSATLSGQSARVQLLESDPGFFNQPDDGPAEFFAEFTGGDERTQTLTLNGGVYEIKYVVDRPDTDPPETVISSGPTGTLFSNQATFEFHADEPSTFQCKLDGGVFEPCSSPKVYTSLAFGGHTFEVRAIDSAGNVDQSPDSRSWTAQQNTAPTITSPKPAPGSAIRDRTPVISAVVKDAETELTQSNITLKVDGSVKSFAYDAVKDKVLRQSSKLAFGKHTVSITATDGKGEATTRVWSFKVVR